MVPAVFAPLKRGARRIAAGLDRTFVRLAFRDNRPGSPQRERVGERGGGEVGADELQALGDFYLEAAASGRLFTAADLAPLPQVRTVRGSAPGQGAGVSDLAWPSRYDPLHDDFRDALERCPSNQTCHARWLHHATPAPVIVLLHGWGGGHFALEARAFPVRWLHERLGLDVVLFNLPFHARRRAERRGETPAFPSSSPVRANEGFAQAVHDLRSLVSILLERFERPAVGVGGMSLGGFTTALLATVEPRLAFAVPMLPFASLADMLWQHGERTQARARAVARGITQAHLAHALAATTPLARSLAIDPTRVLIGAGTHDQVTPIGHAERLHAHFEGSSLVTYPGAHLLQLGRAAMFRELARWLVRQGVVAPREG